MRREESHDDECGRAYDYEDVHGEHDTTRVVSEEMLR